MLGRTNRRYALLMSALAAMATAAPAAAHQSKTGGASALERPEVTELRCDTGDTSACSQGQPLRVSGEHLDETRDVVFLGRRGRRDDRRARPRAASPHRVLVRVPATARTGPIRVRARHASSDRGPRLQIVRTPAQPPAVPPPVQPDGAFPVAGEHTFGTATNGFGGGRDHKGQDIFASCGTPIVAAAGGRVTIAKFHDRAGNYVVVKTVDGGSQAYMHMLKPAVVRRGQQVTAGQALGDVGATGRASGCHLHFEMWTAPGWYEGGAAIDPMPALQRWDTAG